MKKTEKLLFVFSLCQRVQQELESKIESGAIPEDWDGHELRVWLASKFEDEAVRSRAVMKGKRMRSFFNTVATNNL